uniref:Uncharacterized protein n=3 Tax=Canis lupus TaxID=9612 RepID=A0A8C0Q3R2_CANLF
MVFQLPEEFGLPLWLEGGIEPYMIFTTANWNLQFLKLIVGRESNSRLTYKLIWMTTKVGW